MNWIHDFYASSVAIPLSVIGLAVICLLSWMKQGRQIILVLTLVLYTRYLVWRGLYTLNTDDWSSLLVSWTVYTAEVYAFIQVLLFAYHAWSPLERKPVRLTSYPTVDVFITVVDEPLSILRRTVVGCMSQQYPKNRYRVHILDDGKRDEVRQLAASMNCGYIRRADRLHAKAGNLNHALQQTSGEIVAIFDVDHVPTADFLHDTVGMFQDQQVAFVQTPHHFYNPDIFQKNLRTEGVLKNEQALFYRVLQSGRDRHNSAFFAGSCGLFRRRVLEEIGGFRTETVTEDIHTSMVIHAKGYRSCYLNKVLAAGLMPETFESLIKQRVRWATGHVQILFRSNPLTMRGLSLHQRLGYFASIFYFVHGIPRVICLVAPLFALLFGIAPVIADLPTILNFFGSYYLATLVMLRVVSRGTRNAFWSDIYETADSMALGWAALKTALSPRRQRPFVITPKGTRQEKPGFTRFYYSIPHLVVMGLLVAGFVTGIRLWWQNVLVPGLEISLFWGGVNVVLVSVVIMAAAELPEWRTLIRIKRRRPCELVTEKQHLQGAVIDINETGACIHLSEPLADNAGRLLCRIKGTAGEYLVLEATICRQIRLSAISVEIGAKFVEVDEKQTEALIAMAFSDSSVWNQPEGEPGMFRSLWSVIAAFHKLFTKPRMSNRRYLRTPYRQECRLVFRDRIVIGRLGEISEEGFSVHIPGTIDLIDDRGVLYVGGFSGKIRRTWVMQDKDTVIAGFVIERIQKGADQWRALTAQAA
ncbi:MAG: glycosyltransferase [Nitrospira sp.]|nr:glycosyltransferase [Nitrospira sp.]MDH4369633.1 glycosyltransferase [Nitrospira sp.]MDH5347852.1 glycosyltransferase [Nitrospira sp.]MDH5497153.1 glycosyltransferase [Nitrospira sp.]